MVIVLKKSGEREEFDVRKLEHSLENAGASKLMISRVVKKIEKILFDGITTKEIYDKAFKLLKKQSYVSASRYDLKGALLRLGKKGFVFEKYIALLLQQQKYKTETNVILQGKCVSHEIDILAKKNNKKILVECKHHMQPWIGLHIQTALYVYARFLDLDKFVNQAMIVTNTKLTYQAIHYSNCMKIKMLAWNYPKGKGLEYAIEHFKLYPITILQSLPQKEASKLFRRNVLLVKELCDARAAKDLGLKNWKQISHEATGVCHEFPSGRK